MVDYHPHDAKWIKEQLEGLPPGIVATAEAKYSALYRSILDSRPDDHKAENAARAECNERLRLFVERIRSAHSGKTMEPPSIGRIGGLQSQENGSNIRK